MSKARRVSVSLVQGRLAAGTGTVTGPVVVPDAWTIIDLRVDLSTAQRAVEWRVGGVIQPALSVPGGASTASGIRFGTTLLDTYGLEVDDVLVTASASDFPLGDGRVEGLRPNGLGASSVPGNFSNDDGAAIGAATPGRLADSPFGLTSYICQTRASSTSYVGVTLVDPTAMGPRALAATFGFHAAGTQANHGRMVVFDGAAERQVHTGDLSELTLVVVASVLATPTRGWTQAGVAGLEARVGYSVDISPTPYWDAALVEVEAPR